MEITDEQGGVAALAGWLHTVGFVVLHRDNHSLTAVPEDAAPRYTVDLQNPTSYYVRDRLNGYCLNPAHASREAAWEAAQEMNASPGPPPRPSSGTTGRTTLRPRPRCARSVATATGAR